MKIHFVNVGYGEGILITKDNFTMLIDGGTNRQEEYENPGTIRVEKYLNKLGIKHIDIVAITHMHDDHIGGIVNVVKGFSIGEIWINIKPNNRPKDMVKKLRSSIGNDLSGNLFCNAIQWYDDIVNEANNKNIPIIETYNDEKIVIENDISINVLSPNKKTVVDTKAKFDQLFIEKDIDKAKALLYDIDKNGNGTSLSFHITSGKIGALLTGDKVNEWDKIIKEYNSLEGQILKLTHHGQLDGMPQCLVEAVNPEIFVICSSLDRRYNSAHPDIISRAEEFLKLKGVVPQIYITGDLEEGEKPCGICFNCNEDNGEIKPSLIY